MYIKFNQEKKREKNPKNIVVQNTDIFSITNTNFLIIENHTQLIKTKLFLFSIQFFIYY